MKSSRQNRGMALLIVLVIIALLSTLLTELAFSTLVDLRLTETFRDTTRAYYLAKGGVNAGQMILQEDRNGYDSLDEPWSQGVVNYPVGEGAITVRITDQNGKLGINAMVHRNTPSALMIDRFYRLMLALEIDKWGDPAELTAALIDWIDEGESPYPMILTEGLDIPVAGAEAIYYQSLSQPYPVKNGRVETLEELALIKGFTPEILRRVVPHVALHKEVKVNINTASAAVLMSLDPEIDEEVTDILIDYRKETPIKRLEQLEEVLPEAAYIALKTLGNLEQLDLHSNFYQIEAVAVVNDGRRRLVAQVNKKNNKLTFFKVD
jgi:general secretion pathway protein K